MTGKERMTIAMTGGIPDRVPVMPQITVPHAIRVLCRDKYIQGMIQAVEDPMFAIEKIYSVVKLYGADGMRVPLPAGNEDLKVEEQNGGYIIYNKKTGKRLGFLDMLTGNMILDEKNYIENPADVDKIKIPTVDEFYSTRALQIQKEVCENNTLNIMMVGMVGGMAMNYLLEKRGNERALFDLTDEPEFVDELFEIGTKIGINRAKALVKSGVDALYIGDASSSCSLISPGQFERHCFPCYKKFVEELKPLGKPIYLHICGFVRPIVHLMAQTGVDCIEPLDPLGKMSVREFREKVGSRTALMGGVSTLTVANGSTADVKNEAVECIKSGGEKGAYILAVGDMVPNESPIENVKQLCDTARNFIYNTGEG